MKQTSSSGEPAPSSSTSIGVLRSDGGGAPGAAAAADGSNPLLCH